MLITKHLIIKGKVQGVWYRGTTKQQADNLAITGWVKNLTNGDVEAVIQGNEEQISAMLKFCHQGSANAIVSEIEISEVAESDKFQSFEVRY